MAVVRYIAPIWTQLVDADHEYMYVSAIHVYTIYFIGSEISSFVLWKLLAKMNNTICMEIMETLCVFVCTHSINIYT